MGLPLLAPALLLATHHGRCSPGTLLLLSLGRTQGSLLPEVHPDDVLHASPVVLDSPHVRQPGASCPLGRPLHNLYAFYQWAVDLVPHLHADTGKLAAQEDSSVGTATADVDAYASEGIAGALAHKQDVADSRAFWVVLCEKAGSCSGGVEEADLRGVHG